MGSSKKRSPLKAKPLRNPGQSIEEQREDFLLDGILAPMLLAGCMVLLAVLEWYRYLLQLPFTPWLYTALAIGAACFAAFRISRAIPRGRQMKLALDGERAVGQYLELLRVDGYQVFHDVVGEGFNIDHVLIGPAGVLTIETKTFSKAPGPDAKVIFDGERILVDGYEPDRNPVVQAKAQVSWIRELLVSSTGRKLSVRPVIVFPGWWVEQSEGSTREVWVLNPKALPAFLGNAPVMLQPEEIKLASYHLARYIRAKEGELT